MIPGRATSEGTAAFAAKHPAAKGHWRTARGLSLSSVGLGTYLGATDAASRRAYTASALACLRGGLNVIDCAANYREQASERDVGLALQQFVEAGGDRSGVVLSTKAGFLHGDCDAADGDGWFDQEYLGAGDTPAVLRKGDVVSGHSLAAAYVLHELERSRRNLGVEAIDILYLHNPEHQLEWNVPEAEFYARVEATFEALERACDDGRLGTYGVATWDGLRVGPQTKGHLSLVKLIHAAGQARMKAGGRASEHHFRALQLPINMAMTEAYLRPSQPFRFGDQTLLQAARETEMLVFASASLMQMRLAGRIPPEMTAAFGTRDDAQSALQFTRSMPGVTSALVGMATPEHARSNAAFAVATPTDPATVKTMLGTGSVHGW